TILFIIPTMILANTSIGKITALKGIAEIRQGTNVKSAQLGSELVRHDNIITKEKTKVQVIFEDETIITIGENSHFSIDEYITDGSDSEVKLSLFKGAMRAITGKIGQANPGKFKVKTKTATIGIRGTNFVVVSSLESDMVACTLGAITVQGTGSLVTVPSGFMTNINKGGEVQSITAFTSAELGSILDGAFGKKETTDESEKTEESDAISESDTEEESSTEEESEKETNIEVKDTLAIDTTTVEAVSIIEENIGTAVEDTALAITETLRNIAPLYYKGMSRYVFYDDVGKTGGLGINQRIEYGADITTGNFTDDSYILADSGAGGIQVLAQFDPTTGTLTSGTDFQGSVLPFSITEPDPINTGATNTYTLDEALASKNWVRTQADIDPNDNVTWGQWNLPVNVSTSDGGSTSFLSKQNWHGYFISGIATD
ncbi:MAG TPA: hypothetical protein EYO73_08605, partial [Sulfurimonas sp.]|nr:hypothetical protein [Sulfurimonas sp.]